MRLRPRADQLALGLGVRIPAQAEPGSTLRLNLVRRAEEGERLLGGLAVEIRVRKAHGPGKPADGIPGALRGPLPR